MKPKFRTDVFTLATMAVLAGTAPALAISRVDTLGLSCAQVQNVVRSEGAAILRYPSERNPGHILYDRYVRNRHSCLLGQLTERDFIPAADTRSCVVLRCYWPSPDDRSIFRRR